MDAKRTIRKMLFVTVWIIIGGGMLTLIIAAIGKKNHELCRNYNITIKGKQNNFFIDKKDVQKLLVAAMNGNIRGRQISLFNLHQLEQLLEDNNWINDAELYFDNHDVLHVTITEREPVARIFTTAGNSFYIDSIGRRMPLSEKMSARVPVFTSFPGKKILSSDSLLLNDIKAIAKFTYNDPFWMAQAAQFDITPERTFEMIPVVGNHTVKLGNGENIDQKFHRLFVFYKQVLSKTGFDKYRSIDVQYTGQIIASRQSANVKIDSVQLRRNVEKLLRESMEAQADTVADEKMIIGKSLVETDPTTASTTDLKVTADKSSLPAGQAGKKVPNPNPVKTMSVSKPVKPEKLKVIDSKTGGKKENEPGNKKPKAVMPKKVTEDNNGGYN
jgi:cell division protein FtsQ